MKQSKIIYGDGVVERMQFADTLQALEYAREESRRRGTYVRSQAVTGGNHIARRRKLALARI